MRCYTCIKIIGNLHSRELHLVGGKIMECGSVEVVRTWPILASIDYCKITEEDIQLWTWASVVVKGSSPSFDGRHSC